MVKKTFIFIILIVTVFVSSGCWSRLEPKELAVITSIIYDLGEEKTYKTIMEVLSPAAGMSTQSSNGGNQKKFKLIVTEGFSLAEALRNSSEHIERRIYGGSNKVRFFTEKIALSSLKESMDFFLRDHIADERPMMIMIKGQEDPLKIYDVEMGLSEQLGVFAENMVRKQEEATGYSVLVTTLDFVKDYLDEGKQPVMGVIEIKDNDAAIPGQEGGSDQSAPKKVLSYDGLAVFKGEKLSGYMDDKQARAYNVLINKIKEAYYDFPLGEKTVTARLLKSKTDIKTDFKNDKVTVNINIKSKTLLLQDQNLSEDLSDNNVVLEIQKSFNEEMKRQIMETVTKVQSDYKSDIFGFGGYFHNDYPEEWKSIKGRWDDDYFTSAEIVVNVESNLECEGETRQPFGWKKNE